MNSKGQEYIDWFSDSRDDGSNVLRWAKDDPSDYLDGTYAIDWDDAYIPVTEELFVLASEVLSE